MPLKSAFSGEGIDVPCTIQTIRRLNGTFLCDSDNACLRLLEADTGSLAVGFNLILTTGAFSSCLERAVWLEHDHFQRFFSEFALALIPTHGLYAA
jgi:hypothetical protein